MESQGNKIKFGTDGWRGIIAQDFTFRNVKICAQAIASHLSRSHDTVHGVVVGYDTRFLSDRFAQIVCDVISSNGIPVFLSDKPIPTPACSLGVKQLGASLGVMVTASHNPKEWNGLKIKSAEGGSASPEIISEIEARISNVLIGNEKILRDQYGIIKTVDLNTPFIDQIARVSNVNEIKSENFKVVVDAMYGSANGILQNALNNTTISVREINNVYNPGFPGIDQPEPVEKNLGTLKKAVKDLGADVGIALDGDGDRLGIVDENGNYQSTLEVFSILANHLLGTLGEKGGIACTITMSNMVEKICERYGQQVFRTPVGFKYVAPVMEKNRCLMGGEESGGYAVKDHIPERDGALSALLYLQAMAMSQKKPSDLLKEVHKITGPYTFKRIDLEFNDKQKIKINNTLIKTTIDSLGGLKVKKIDRLDGIRFNLEQNSWAAVRLSGTEPLARIYSEARDKKTLDAIIKDLRQILSI